MSLCLATAGGVGIRPRPRIIIWALRDADLEFMHEEIKLAALGSREHSYCVLSTNPKFWIISIQSILHATYSM